MLTGLTIELNTTKQPAHDVKLGVFRGGLVDRAREELTLTGDLAIAKRGNRRQRKLLTGYVIGVPRLARDRWQVVGPVRSGAVARVHHLAAERQMDEVRGLVLRPGAIVPEVRHPRDDETRVPRQQLFPGKPHRGEEVPGGAVDQHVGPFDERLEGRLPLFGLEVDRDRALAAVVGPKEQRALRIDDVVCEGTNRASRAPCWRLDLDDVGTEPG